MVFQQMDEVWRASKSRLVKKIRKASNEEERLKLQHDNIKSVHDWKDFVKEKTSADFKDAMEKVERDTPNLSSTNLNEDAVSKVLGAEKRSRLRTFGKGVTKTKLAILSQMNSHFSQLHEENMQLKSQMTHMQNSVDELKRNQSISTHSNSNKCKLLDWMGTREVVAEGH